MQLDDAASARHIARRNSAEQAVNRRVGDASPARQSPSACQRRSATDISSQPYQFEQLHQEPQQPPAAQLQLGGRKRHAPGDGDGGPGEPAHGPNHQWDNSADALRDRQPSKDGYSEHTHGNERSNSIGPDQQSRSQQQSPSKQAHNGERLDDAEADRHQGHAVPDSQRALAAGSEGLGGVPPPPPVEQGSSWVREMKARQRQAQQPQRMDTDTSDKRHAGGDRDRSSDWGGQQLGAGRAYDKGDNAGRGLDDIRQRQGDNESGPRGVPGRMGEGRDVRANDHCKNADRLRLSAVGDKPGDRDGDRDRGRVWNKDRVRERERGGPPPRHPSPMFATRRGSPVYDAPGDADLPLKPERGVDARQHRREAHSSRAQREHGAAPGDNRWDQQDGNYGRNGNDRDMQDDRSRREDQGRRDERDRRHQHPARHAAPEAEAVPVHRRVREHDLLPQDGEEARSAKRAREQHLVQDGREGPAHRRESSWERYGAGVGRQGQEEQAQQQERRRGVDDRYRERDRRWGDRGHECGSERNSSAKVRDQDSNVGADRRGGGARDAWDAASLQGRHQRDRHDGHGVGKEGRGLDRGQEGDRASADARKQHSQEDSGREACGDQLGTRDDKGYRGSDRAFDRPAGERYDAGHWGDRPDRPHGGDGPGTDGWREGRRQHGPDSRARQGDRRGAGCGGGGRGRGQHWERDGKRGGSLHDDAHGPRPRLVSDPAVPEAGAEGVNSADIVKAMMAKKPGTETTTAQGPAHKDPAAAAAAAAAIAASLSAGGGAGGAPGLSREQKLQKLWGAKKAGAGEAVVQALTEPAKVDAGAVYGHNRWDAAEFESDKDKERFQRLMGINQRVAAVVAPGPPAPGADPLAGHTAMKREEQAKVLQEMEEAFNAGIRHTATKTGLGVDAV